MPERFLAATGMSRASAKLYEQLRPLSGRTLSAVAHLRGSGARELREALEELISWDAVEVSDGLLIVHPPRVAFTRVLARQSVELRTAGERLYELAAALPMLEGLSEAPADGEAQPLQGERMLGGSPLAEVTQHIAQGTGDLLWLRPDQWRWGHEDDLSDPIRDALTQGRRSRAIYPVRILEEAPELLSSRAALGEQVRILAEVPVRMVLVGHEVAVMGAVGRESYGAPRVTFREPILLQLAVLAFERLWERALVVPGLPNTTIGGAQRRSLLLTMLSEGARDEQIARATGQSLRTVRRHVAELMDELGVETRFQAGIAAVRRGWV